MHRLCLPFLVISVVCAEMPISNEGTTESPAVVLAKGRTLQTLMIASMRQPESVARLGEVLPLLRSMTRQQRTVMKAMLKNATMAALDARPETNTARPSLGGMLPELNVASLLRRGDEELTRETNEAARARALESLEIVADTENVDTRAFASRNDTQLDEEVPEDMPVAEELRGRRLTPNELLALIAANKRLPQPELVALIGEHHRRISEPRRTSGGRPGHRLPPRTVVRGPQTSQRLSSVRPPEPSECDLFSNNLCLEVPNYPREAILASMQRNPTAVSAMLSHESRLDLGERRQDDTENLVLGEEAGQTLCHTAVKYARPKRARNVAGRWKFLVNMGSEHSQTMRIEVCNTPGEACHYLAQGVASQCVQLFSHHRLMAWDKEEGLHIDIFKVPTCCSCHVQPAYGPAMFPHASADTSHRPRQPTAEEAEPDFTEDDEYEDPESELQGSSFQKSRVPPHANWSPNRPRRPTTSYQPPSPPTQTYQPNVVKQRQPIEITTFPPIFNKDLRKRNRYRNKNRQDSIDDLEDSETMTAPQMPPQKTMPHTVSTEPPHFLPTTLRPVRPPAPVVTNAPIIRPPQPPPPTRPPAPAIRRPSRPRPSQVEIAEDGSRINYSYHPIIDFFREDQQRKQQQVQRRADKLVSSGDEWRPIVPASNRMSLRGA